MRANVVPRFKRALSLPKNPELSFVRSGGHAVRILALSVLLVWLTW